MYLKRDKKKNGRVYLSITESYRNAEGVQRNRVVRSLGYLDDLTCILFSDTDSGTSRMDAGTISVTEERTGNGRQPHLHRRVQEGMRRPGDSLRQAGHADGRRDRRQPQDASALGPAQEASSPFTSPQRLFLGSTFQNMLPWTKYSAPSCVRTDS